MKKILLVFLFILIFVPFVSAQRIIFQSDFENITLQSPDSIPLGWFKMDVDLNNPSIGWAVRDTSVNFGGPTRPKANNYSAKSLEIPWYAGQGGNNINDDWIWTDSFTVQQGDSLIWWMLIGTDTSFAVTFSDSMQVYVCSDQDPILVIQKLATIVSLDTNLNVWTEHKFDLSPFTGQRIYVAFRYNMDVSIDGLWCNIDDLFIGNHSAIGIRPISGNVPKKFDLRQNHPNPFNPVTNIEFDLPKSEFVSLVIYNSLGQETKTLLNQDLRAGTYRVDFNASGLSSGVYFYRLTAGDFVKTMKMVLVK